jgi:hypothetical protein
VQVANHGEEGGVALTLRRKALAKALGTTENGHDEHSKAEREKKSEPAQDKK